jgi:hypothetical protein
VVYLASIFTISVAWQTLLFKPICGAFSVESKPHLNLLNQRITDEKDILFRPYTEQITSKMF